MDNDLALEKALSAVPKTRVPLVDLQNRGKDYLLKAEMPGFKKQDIEIQAYDSKNEKYICKESACETFYRMVHSCPRK